MTSAVELPNDVEALKALVLEQRNAIVELAGKLTWAEEKLRVWELRYFGRKAEKVSPAEEKQNRLFDEAEANADESGIKVTEKVTVPAHERAKRGRKPKTDRLPTIEVIHDLNPEERSCPCCGEARPEIGEERSSEYDLVPAHVRRIEHVRKKYGPCACSAFQASGTAPIKTAAGPAKIVKGSDFTNRSIAFFSDRQVRRCHSFPSNDAALGSSGTGNHPGDPVQPGPGGRTVDRRPDRSDEPGYRSFAGDADGRDHGSSPKKRRRTTGKIVHVGVCWFLRRETDSPLRLPQEPSRVFRRFIAQGLPWLSPN
jgi:hypothetical protein